MTVRRRRQHPSDFGRASTFVETVELPELAELSGRFLRAIDYYGLVELEYKRDPRDGGPSCSTSTRGPGATTRSGPPPGVDFPYLLYLDQLGHDVPAARARAGGAVGPAGDRRAERGAATSWRGRLGRATTCASLRGVDTEAVFSLRDPLPGLFELALLPYLAVRRGL